MSALAHKKIKDRIDTCVACPLYFHRVCSLAGVFNTNRGRVVFVLERPFAEDLLLSAKAKERIKRVALEVFGGAEGADAIFRRSSFVPAIKCPGSREQTYKEMINSLLKCQVHLADQIQYIRPQMIVALGNLAYASLVGDLHSRSTPAPFKNRPAKDTDKKVLIVPSFSVEHNAAYNDEGMKQTFYLINEYFNGNRADLIAKAHEVKLFNDIRSQ